MLMDDTSCAPAQQQLQQAPAAHGCAAMQQGGFSVAPGHSMASVSSGSLAVGSQQQPMQVTAAGLLQPPMMMQQPLQSLGLPANGMVGPSGMVQPGAMAGVAASTPCMLPPALAGMPAHLMGMEQSQSRQLQAPGPRVAHVNVGVSVAALKQQYAQVQNMLHGLSEQLRVMAELEQAVSNPADSGPASSCMHMLP